MRDGPAHTRLHRSTLNNTNQTERAIAKRVLHSVQEWRWTLLTCCPLVSAVADPTADRYVPLMLVAAWQDTTHTSDMDNRMGEPSVWC